MRLRQTAGNLSQRRELLKKRTPHPQTKRANVSTSRVAANADRAPLKVRSLVPSLDRRHPKKPTTPTASFRVPPNPHHRPRDKKLWPSGEKRQAIEEDRSGRTTVCAEAARIPQWPVTPKPTQVTITLCLNSCMPLRRNFKISSSEEGMRQTVVVLC